MVDNYSPINGGLVQAIVQIDGTFVRRAFVECSVCFNERPSVLFLVKYGLRFCGPPPCFVPLDSFEC
jgi:hypothetical protein